MEEENVIDPKQVIELSDAEQLMFALYRKALELNLEIFLFEKEELLKYYNVVKDIAIVTIAKNKDNAIWNLQNQKRCYVLNDYNKEKNESRN